MNVSFRVDASTRIGWGHLMRCYTLADELRRRGAAVQFICRQAPGDGIRWLESRGISCERLPPGEGIAVDEEIAQAGACLARDSAKDWLVVDHYGLDAHWESAMRRHAERILSIDDLPGRKHDCDMLLDQNYRGGIKAPYTGLLPEAASILLGPRFALLRPEFGSLRAQGRRRNGAVERVLLCMGAADSANATAVVLEALRGLRGKESSWTVDIVLGEANSHAARVGAMSAGLDWVRIHHPAADMASLLAQADLAIGAGGTANWERACLGVPSLVFALSENQRDPLRHLIEGGYVAGDLQPLNVERVSRWLRLLLANPDWLRGLESRSAGLVDGDGARRVVSRMLGAQITFRRAHGSDCDKLWQWRNSSSVRQGSADPGEIDLAEHRRWFKESLSNPGRILLVAERGGEPLGVVRFDLDERLATVSVYRIPGSAASGGLVREASRWLREQRPDLRGIVAEVLAENEASFAAFVDAGYRPIKNCLLLEWGRRA